MIFEGTHPTPRISPDSNHPSVHMFFETATSEAETLASAMNEDFANDVLAGLTAKPKALPSKYFYNETGDKLFQAIMKLPEYYLTDCEYEVFSMQKQRFLELFANDCQRFDLIEFGAGDGFKTKILLEHFLDAQASFRYVPIDISGNVLEELSGSLSARWPELDVAPIENDYFRALEAMPSEAGVKKVVLFLGSNIGNFSPDQANDFYQRLRERLNPGDLVVTGIDLMKDPEVILAAYNDKAGVTKAFNINLLQRINDELDADFDLTNFAHFPTYDPLTGATRSFLINQKPQTVVIKKLGAVIEFGRSEPIYMEQSRKYNIERIEELASSTGFSVVEHVYDCKHWFTNTVCFWP